MAQGYAVWTYIVAVVYAVAGILLLIGKKTRAAATAIGLGRRRGGTVCLRAGRNFIADTLMFCGAVLLLAGAMPRER